MGLEFTRGNSTRCPPFLVGGLMIMCLFLLCSWWSLSSQNFELLRQSDNLSEQLRINEDLRKSQLAKQELQQRQMKDEEQKLQECETEMASLRNLGESKEKTLETLRAEKISLENELKKEKDNMYELKKELKVKDEKITILEKDVEEKNTKISELEKRLMSLKSNNINKADLPPIVKVLEKNKKNKNAVNNINNEQKEAARGDNQDLPLLHDENNGGEARNEADQGIEEGNSREQLMSGTPSIIDN